MIRRNFLKLCAFSAPLATACHGKLATRSYPGVFQGATHKVGHLLRDKKFPQPQETRKTKVAIVGGGVSGLIAARKLLQSGIKEIMLFELEDQVGGNSSSGENEISAYPWGAHYLPVPNQESEDVRALCLDLGLIHSTAEDGRPTYKEEFLCHEPEEHLFIHGRIQNGILPTIGIGSEERRQYKEFFSHIAELRMAVGEDQKPAFSIPIELSSQDPKFLALDSQTFAEYLDAKGWSSAFLRWYTNYCCRDDYGATENEVSAWAGLHYFASRRAYGANVSGYQLLTWPEGNGWLVKHLRDDVSVVTQTGALVHEITELSNPNPGLRLKVLLPRKNQAFIVEADYLIAAIPRFTLPHLMPALRNSPPDYLKDLHYSPWVVANVSIKNYAELPQLAWDNVSYHSDTLGFVVATHQRLGQSAQASVLTCYLPLSDRGPKEAREFALKQPLTYWQQLFATDLRRFNPALEKAITQIDIWIWGHAMAQPRPGFLWGEQRKAMQAPLGNIYFAHSDMSGISIFEEAQYHGLKAAEAVASKLKG